jgi:hypothetical protein
MRKNRTKIKTGLIFGLCIGLSGAVFAESQVNFSLSLNTTKDPGATYTGFHAAGAGTASEHVIGFQVKVNSVNATNVTLSPVAAFCSELQESISTSTYTFTSRQLQYLSAGQAGKPGTASSAIPVGGIGEQRAAYVSYLFDRYYTAEALTGWTYTATQPTTHAFQLALWEMTHDSDLNITNSTGNIYVANQSSAQRNAAISLAQSMLSDVAAANLSSSYVSTNFFIFALANVGNPGNQDIVFATRKDSATYAALAPLVTLPEPSVQALASLVAGLVWFGTRVRRHVLRR